MIVNVQTDPGYQVHIEAGARALLPSLVTDASRIGIVFPEPLSWLAEQIAGLLPAGKVLALPVPDAEAAKTPAVLAGLWDRLAAAGFTRNDAIVGLGGGATTDLAGFLAATWLRGVRYVAMPTSVLAAVDAAVGGKTGINLTAGKNLVGAFYEPAAVLCDLELFASLPAAEISSGLAEVIKCGFIADPEILRLVAEQRPAAQDPTSEVFAELVARAVQVKATVVSADLFEATSTLGNVGREALNYGHTLGHAIEAGEHFTWRHGPAISVGMVWMAEVSRRLLGLDDATVRLHRELLGGVGLPTTYSGDWDQLRAAMSLDKKSRGSALRLIGLPEIGRVELVADPPEDVLAEAFAVVSGSQPEG